MRRYLLALALFLLLAADLGWKAWSERPYVVTGWEYRRDPVVVRVSYTLPGGGVGHLDTIPSEECGGRLGLGYTIPKACQE